MRGPRSGLRQGLAVVAAATLLAGCSGDGAGDSAETATAESAGTAADAPVAVEEEAPAADGGGAAADGGESAGGSVGLAGLDLGRQVIRTASLRLRVTDPAEAVRAITRLVQRSGGFVAGADLQRGPAQGDDAVVEGHLTLRVPADQLEATLQGLDDIAEEVVSRSIDTQDVTTEYTDLQAQLRNLRAFEAQLLELLEQVRNQDPSAQELITVFERIRQVRGEIERLQGRKQVLDDRIALATIDVRLLPSDDLPIVAAGWEPGSVIRSALHSTVTALQGVANVTIWLVLTVVPIGLVIAVPLGLLVSATRRWQRRGRTTPA